MQLIGECKRTILGSGNASKKMIKRKIAEHSDNSGMIYHNVFRRNGLFWLVSGTTEGIPLVESVISSLNISKPFIVFYRTPKNVLLMAYVYGDKLDVIVESRVNKVTDLVVTKALEFIHTNKGQVIIIDDALEPDCFTSVPLILSTSELLQHTKMLLTGGDQHKPPITVQQVLFTLLVVLTFISLILFFISGESDKDVKKTAINEFAKFEQGLEKRGSVKGMTYQLYKDLLFINHLVGWKATRITINNDLVYIDVEKHVIGRLDNLFEIVSKTGRLVSDFSENKATIVSQHQALPALSEAILIPIEHLQIYIGFAQDDWLSAERTKLKFNKINGQAKHSEVELEWDVESYFKEDLDVMGTLLNMIPIVFNTATLTLNDDETFSGKFKFTLFGCEKIKCEGLK